MAARPILVVLVVGDAVLRSMLVKRLAMHGVELLSAGNWGEVPFEGPMIRPQSILVADEAAGGHSDRIERQRRKRKWRRVVMLTAATSAANDRWQLGQAERCAPADLLSFLFANGTRAAA